MRCRAVVGIVAGLLVFTALRLALIHTSLVDVLYWEEPYRLTVATELLAGGRLPFGEYQADHYQGGSLVVGTLAVPVVAALGPTYEALKLVPLGFALATALVWTAALWRALGPGTATLGLWLLAVGPPYALVYQIHAMGSHAESALFAAVVVLLTLEVLHGTTRRAIPFAVGLVGGLGIWFCYTAATALAACALVVAMAGPRGSVRRSLGPALIGGLLGLLPWLVYNLGHGFAGFERLTELFDPLQREPNVVREPFLARLGALVGVDLPRSFGFRDAVPGVPGLPSWLFFALVAGAAFGIVRLAFARDGGRGRDFARILAVYVPLHLFAYAVSSFRIDVENGFIAYRFFAPLFPIAAVMLAISAARLGRRHRAAAAMVVGTTLVLGTLGFAGLVERHVSDDPPPMGSGYKVMGLLTHLKHRRDIDQAIAIIGRLDDDARALALFGLGWGLEFQYEKDGDWPAVLDVFRRLEQPFDRRAMLEGLRWSLVQRVQQSRDSGNAGFRTAYNRTVHERTLALSALVAAFERTLVAPAPPDDGASAPPSA